MEKYSVGFRRIFACALGFVIGALLLYAVPAFADEPEEDNAEIAVAALGEEAPSLSGVAHVQDEGNLEAKDFNQGIELGTSGKAERLEAIRIETSNPDVGLKYQVHVESIGWQDWVATGELAGTEGQALRLEAVKIWLDDDNAPDYDIYYRAHVQDIGWMGWAKNGQAAGSQGQALRMEALQVVLMAKNVLPPTPSPKNDTDISYSCPMVTTEAHVQNIGWQDPVSDGKTAGTTGQALRVEGIRVMLNGANLGVNHEGMSGDIYYRAHVQNIGWQDWVKNGELAGTTGQSLQVEAFQVRLEGAVANVYDVYYRVHAQSIGWMGWTMGGEPAGTSGSALRLEAIEVKLVLKDDPDKPTPTADSFRDGGAIMGTSLTTVDKMVAYFNQKTNGAYQQYYVDHPEKLIPNITAFCQFVFDEANAEGVRAEVLFAQAMHETGFLKFGNLVQPEQCNFGGLGATGPGVPGNYFDTAQVGLRAQAQHLKAYASTAPLNNACVDNRFTYVKRGCAPTVSGLSGTWAADDSYGNALKQYMDELLAL